MAPDTSPYSSSVLPVSDVGEIWEEALSKYGDITSVDIRSLLEVKNVDDILRFIQMKNGAFESRRHNKSRWDKLRTIIKDSLLPIENLSKIVASATSNPFSPSSAIFTAVVYLISAVTVTSADYDRLTSFFEDLASYLGQLSILEGDIPPTPEVRRAIANVLSSVLTLCGLSVRYMKKKRISKAFKSLLYGEDKDLALAYERFQKNVDQERHAVLNATFLAAQQLKQNTAAISSDVKENRQAIELSVANTDYLLTSTRRIEEHLLNQTNFNEQDTFLKNVSTLVFDQKRRDVFAKHHPGTGAWLLETPQFQDWVKGNSKSALWCPGHPGAGKTVMVTIAIDHVLRRVENSHNATIYLFCDFNDPQTQNEFNLLSSFARQLAEQAEHIPSDIMSQIRLDHEGQNSLSSERRLSLIQSFLPFFETVYVFVDALDEMPEVERDRLLKSLKKIEPRIRLFLTSRPHIDIGYYFDLCSRINIEASQADIEAYLKHAISSSRNLSKFVEMDPMIEHEIVQSVVKQSNGMFLLANLLLGSLSQQISVRKTRKALEMLPRGITATYEAALERIGHQSHEYSCLATRALSFVAHARRALHVDELRHALATEIEDANFAEEALIETNLIIEVSVGLIHIDNGSREVHLVHHTLQEFFDRSPEKLNPYGEEELAMTCLTYVTYDDFSDGPSQSQAAFHGRLQHYKFLQYASNYLGQHLRSSRPDVHPEILSDPGKLSSVIQVLFAIDKRRHKKHTDYPEKFSPLHAAVYWGLANAVTSLCCDGKEVNLQDDYGFTPLQLAAQNGYRDVTEILLQSGADVSIQNESGQTALYWAARNNHKKVIELLLESNAKVTAKDRDGWTALDWAAAGGHNDIIELLLNRGADTKPGDEGIHKTLCLAADEGHEATIQILLNHGADINKKDRLGSTALDWAVPRGHEEAVKVLLANGADLTSRDIFGNTALHWAVLHQNITQLLINYKGDANAQNDEGQTALHWSSLDSSLEVTRLLIGHGANVNTPDNNGFTALHRAALRGREQVVEFLLLHGANPNAEDCDGWKPLHLAALNDHKNLLPLLGNEVHDKQDVLRWMDKQVKSSTKQALLQQKALSKATGCTAVSGLRSACQEGDIGLMKTMLAKGADVDEQDVGGWTALIIAAGCNHLEATRILLEEGANTEICGYDRQTALHIACGIGAKAVVHNLLASGAQIDATAYAWTPLLFASRNGHTSTVRSLLENGAKIGTKDFHGRTATHWAAESGSSSLLQLLINEGAEVNETDNWGNTPLIWAIRKQMLSIFDMLLGAGADLGSKSRDGSTALHWVAFSGSIFIAEKILDSWQDVDVKNSLDFTPLHVAVIMGNENIVQLLLQRGADTRIGLPISSLMCKTVDHLHDALTDADMEDVEENAVLDGISTQSLSKLTLQELHKQDIPQDLGGGHNINVQQLAIFGHQSMIRELLSKTENST